MNRITKESLHDLLYVSKQIVLHSSWEPFFNQDEVKTEIKKISDHLQDQISQGVVISPTFDRVFEAFILTPYNELSCVIVGQDPAPEPHLATGLAFSIDPHINTSEVPSIQRILLELINEGYVVNTLNGDMTCLAEQGVLLINTVLTIPIDPTRNYGIIDAHKALWSSFTHLLFNYLDINERAISFILWGSQAKSFDRYVKAKKRIILEGAHPSPVVKGGSFFCKNYFSATNEFLKKSGSKEIDWNLAQKGAWEWDPQHKISVYTKPCSALKR